MKKQCRRKIYALVNPIAFAIEGSKPLEGEKLRELQMHELTAIEAFRTGTATVDDWSKLVGMMNLAEQMANCGIGREVLPHCQDMSQHMLTSARRYEQTGRMAATGPALQSMREVYAFHDLQRTSVTLSQYEKHIKDTASRIRSKAPEVIDVLEAA